MYLLTLYDSVIKVDMAGHGVEQCSQIIMIYLNMMCLEKIGQRLGQQRWQLTPVMLPSSTLMIIKSFVILT